MAPQELFESGPAPVSERTEILTHPAPVSILLTSKGRLLACAVLVVLGTGAAMFDQTAKWGLLAVVLGFTLALLVLVLEALRRRATTYFLSDGRICARWGLLTRVATEVGLPGVREVALRRTVGERLLGLGTIAVATAGSEGYQVVWRHVDEPDAVLNRLRRLLESWHSARPPSTLSPVQPMMTPMSGRPAPTSTPLGSLPPPIIGLAGGIGAGKSTIARLFESLGCYVIDSDARAKAALDRPEVRARLLDWWGPIILARDGRVDRSQVARIIFADPDQRARLEALVHPIVRQDRAALIAEALKFWPRAIIVDAPLLFEAGVDKECDAVVFVDTPLDERLRRVQDSRGWDQAELARRESSQWPLEAKRAASDFEVQNLGPRADVLKQLAAILDRVRLAKTGQPPPDPNPLSS